MRASFVVKIGPLRLADVIEQCLKWGFGAGLTLLGRAWRRRSVGGCRILLRLARRRSPGLIKAEQGGLEGAIGAADCETSGHSGVDGNDSGPNRRRSPCVITEP